MNNQPTQSQRQELEDERDFLQQEIDQPCGYRDAIQHAEMSARIETIESLLTRDPVTKVYYNAFVDWDPEESEWVTVVNVGGEDGYICVGWFETKNEAEVAQAKVKKEGYVHTHIIL